jgi:hypothetical protein
MKRNIVFGTLGTERMRIIEDGKVGFGTDQPHGGVHAYDAHGTAHVIVGPHTATGRLVVNDIANAKWCIETGGYTFNFRKHNSSSATNYSSWDTKFKIAGNYAAFCNPDSPAHNGDSYAASALLRDYNCWASVFNHNWLGNSQGWGMFWAGSSGASYRRQTSDTNPNECVFVGGGTKRITLDLDGGDMYLDGYLNNANYDYAEYFEWGDGNPDGEDRRGYSVVLVSDGKIKKATSDDDPMDIIGVVSGTSAIVGDAAAYNWGGKYELDEWGTRIKDEVYQLTWSVELENGETKGLSYDEDRVPEGVIVPENAERRLKHRERITPEYDENEVYVPRDKRKEWSVVGLLGKVRVRDESPKHPSWKYLKTIAGKKLWLIK